MFFRVVIRMASDPHLLEIINALASSGGFSGGLDGGEQDGHEDADDGDHDQQFNKRETM
jgi:hypothetical protein